MSNTKVIWRIPAIDGLRALASLMVFGFHSYQFAGAPVLMVPFFGTQINMLAFLDAFPAGVDLFMVLSGFCLFWPLCKSAEALAAWDWRDYAWRRVRRIVPPYYMAIVYTIMLPVVLVALFRMLHMDANWQPLPSLRQFVTHVLFIHTLFPDTWNGITGAFWSLGLEAQFYVAFPFVIFAFRRSKAVVLVGMVLISIIYRVITWNMTADAGFDKQMVTSIFFLGRWMQFAAGMGAAWIVATHWRHGGRLRNGWFGTSLAAVALVLYILATTTLLSGLPKALPMRDLLLSAAFGLGIVAICATHTPLRFIFSNRVSSGIGYFSYSIFLIHQPTAWYMSEMFKKKLHVGGLGDFFLLATVGLVIVCGISYLFFLVFEKPFLNAKRRPKPALETDPAVVTLVVQPEAAP